MELATQNQTETTVEEYSQKIVTTTRFGIIKLMGDKKEYEIKWDTYQKIKKLPPSFSGMVEIEELGLMVPVSQITLITSGERLETQFKDFVGLPVERVELDTDLNIIHGLKREIEGKYSVYYTAMCHYNTKDGEKEYILEKDKIKELSLLKKDDDGYGFYISGVWRYGKKVL